MFRPAIFFTIFFLSSLPALESLPITSHPVVGYQKISFFDHHYQQPRDLLIWYPVEPGTKGNPSSEIWDVFDIAANAPIIHPSLKKPIIIISHGFGGSPHQLSWLINRFVHDGYIVIAIKHLDLLYNQLQINFWKRAQDIHTLLNQFEQLHFADFSDLNRIGFAGFSIGGTTGIWLAGGVSDQLEHFIPGPEDAHFEESKWLQQGLPYLNQDQMVQSWQDNRIKALFLMAPAWGWIFNKASLQKIAIPTYIVASNNDQVLVAKNNGELFSKKIQNSIYRIIIGKAGHYIFVSKPKEIDKLPSHLHFLVTDSACVDRTWIQFEVARIASDFFQSIDAMRN